MTKEFQLLRMMPIFVGRQRRPGYWRLLEDDEGVPTRDEDEYKPLLLWLHMDGD